MPKGPKMKTHKSTAKRFKVTGTGKLMRTKIGKSHLRRRKAARRPKAVHRRWYFSHVSRLRYGIAAASVSG